MLLILVSGIAMALPVDTLMDKSVEDNCIAVVDIDTVVDMYMDIAAENPTLICPILYRSPFQTLCHSLAPILFRILDHIRVLGS